MGRRPEGAGRQEHEAALKTSGLMVYLFFSEPSLISSRRPRLTCSGGDGILISRTPFLNVAFA